MAQNRVKKGDSLNKKELQVYKYLLKGWGVNKIAAKLDRSNKTVENQKGNIYKKLGVKSHPELIVKDRNKNYMKKPKK